MKKLNKKGFTLIELLAIIVILAIIMVVTIPTILNATETTTDKQLKNAADSIEKWVSDQYVLAGINSAEATFKNVCGNNGNTCTTSTGVTLNPTNTNDAALLKAAGVVATDYSKVVIKINDSNNRACITVYPSETGSFASVYEEDASGNVTTKKESNGC